MKVKVIQTAKETQKAWQEMPQIELTNDFSLRGTTVFVDSSKEFQTHMGFGGAFTEASAHVYANTSKENQAKIIEAYFDKEKGLAYNMGRTTVGGCDFALGYYSYVEDGDKTMDSFDMSHDDAQIVPMIKAAEAKAGQKLTYLASPWSPPAYMKDTKDVDHGGKLLDEYYPVWAKYIVKYIKGLKERGIDINMLTTQNEPEAVQPWASCEYDATEEARLAVDYVYEELKKEGLENDVKILIWDHNRDGLYRRTRETLAYPGAKDVVWGAAYHWYVSEKSENLSMVKDAFPQMHLLFSEGCVEVMNVSGGTSSKEGIGSWTHGETYGRNMINDFNNYNEGWLDWNLLLDERGGPNYVENFCEAPITLDRNNDEVIFNWSYYYIGHLSRYIKPGAKRILSRNDIEHDVFNLAYKNPDGSIVVVVQNEADEAKPFILEVDGSGKEVTVPEHSITTFVVEK